MYNIRGYTCEIIRHHWRPGVAVLCAIRVSCDLVINRWT